MYMHSTCNFFSQTYWVYRCTPMSTYCVRPWCQAICDFFLLQISRFGSLTESWMMEGPYLSPVSHPFNCSFAAFALASVHRKLDLDSSKRYC